MLKPKLRLMAIAGGVLPFLGLVLIPLPGPDMLLLVLGVLLLAIAVIVRAVAARGDRSPLT